jgi:hypothetical protein
MSAESSVYQPKYAAHLNLIEPWWKTLRSLALKGRRFETWKEVVEAIEAATVYWNAHKHPFVWGRRRHQPRPFALVGLSIVLLSILMVMMPSKRSWCGEGSTALL